MVPHRLTVTRAHRKLRRVGPSRALAPNFRQPRCVRSAPSAFGETLHVKENVYGHYAPKH